MQAESKARHKDVKVIIAGSRDIDDYAEVELAVFASGFEISEVVSGTAPGVDTLGEDWARNNWVPVVRFPASWKPDGINTDGRAGIFRNEKMGDYAARHDGGLIAVYDGESRGTRHMIQYAKQIGLKVYVHHVAFDGSTLPKFY